MKNQRRSEGISFISSDQKIVDLESHCRKIHSEAVIEAVVLAFSAPLKAADKLFASSPKPADGEQGQAVQEGSSG